jgi:hypothetical protein
MLIGSQLLFVMALIRFQMSEPQQQPHQQQKYRIDSNNRTNSITPGTASSSTQVTSEKSRESDQ